jgi:hypothetical protein
MPIPVHLLIAAACLSAAARRESGEEGAAR